jgi:hypothetical protein
MIFPTENAKNEVVRTRIPILVYAQRSRIMPSVLELCRAFWNYAERSGIMPSVLELCRAF